MCRSVFIIGIPDRYRRAAHGSHHQPNTYNNKGDTEPLSHVQGHVFLKGYLVVLYKFYNKTRQECTYEKYPQQQTLTLLGVTSPIHIHK